MKALIVDDEDWIRLGLREQIDWDAMGIEVIGEATNGGEALDFIRVSPPDIVLTDILMPGMDGLELMARLSEEYPSIAIIVISGHSEFSYAKKAMGYKVVDYILKPIEEEQLENVLRKAVIEIRHKRSEQEQAIQLNIRLNEHKRLIFAKRWVDLLTNINPLPLEAQQVRDQTGIYFPYAYVTVMALRADNFQEIVERKYSGNSELLGFAVDNILEEALNDSPDAFSFPNSSKPNEFLILVGFNDIHNARNKRRMDELTRALNSILIRFSGLKARIGISENAIWLDLNRSYLTSLEALRSAGMHDAVGGVFRAVNLSLRTESAPFSEDKVMSLLYGIEHGYRKQVTELITRFFEEVSVNWRIHPASIKRVLLDWVLRIEKLLQVYFNEAVEAYPNQGQNPGERLDDWYVLADIKEWIERFIYGALERIEAAKRILNQDSIEAIVDYIKGHFNEAVTLNGMAKRYYVSSAYLSRSFKQRTGENFNDFLNRIRIERASELLEEPSMKMSDIAERVGYENANYFMKKFKDIRGLTPTEYRRKLKKV